MPLTVHGRFFQRDESRLFLRAVTYGPFPPGSALDDSVELKRIAEAGFNTVRTYREPSRDFLDQLAEHDLTLVTTIPWHWDSLFCENRETVRSARKALTRFLTEKGDHPALGAVLIANEIRPDLVRFMGPIKVREVLEDLISHGREIAPEVLFAYSNFPTTEYLEPRNADFTAFNIYLEDAVDLENYLRRLQNVAGDRPLLLTEFGFNTFDREDSGRDLEQEQADKLSWALQTSQREAVAGFTVYSWSDRWFNGGREITRWSFGLTRRDRSEKPALKALVGLTNTFPEALPCKEKFTIAVCTRNGESRLCENLLFFDDLEDGNFELLIIDDGSTDRTSAIAAQYAERSSLEVRILRQEPAGLSAARNLAAREASGAVVAFIDDDARPHPLWLRYLREAFARGPQVGAAGGPNLAPAPVNLQNALITACPGNPTHVLLDDVTAEHLPGCNLAIRRDLLLEIGGFDEQFRTAGDDVDICWRLREAGYELAFHAAACVAHDRRAEVRGFIRQQSGYGQAEGDLYRKHPDRFGRHGIEWEGVIYTGAAITPLETSVIYHGPLGEAPFQMLRPHQMPIRPLAEPFDSPFHRRLVTLLHRVASYCRNRSRVKNGGPDARRKVQQFLYKDSLEQSSRRDFQVPSPGVRSKLLHALMADGWKLSELESEADVERGPLKLITAQTLQEDGSAELHLRVIHPPISLLEVWREVDRALREVSRTED